MKHSAPSFPKNVGWPANSGLMFQMNVGCLALASRSAPVNSVVATNVANALSCGEALLHRLAVLPELVVAVGADHELAAVDAAARVHHVEVRLDAVDERARSCR